MKPGRVCLIGLIAKIATAQSAGVVAFEVASIKPHPEPVTFSQGSDSSPRPRWIAVTLRDLIVDAYGLKNYQLTGGPQWAESDHFDVTAKTEGAVIPGDGQFRLMVQSLLADRFQLKVHRETREMPIYALLVGKNGSKLNAPDMNSRNSATVGGPAGIHSYSAHGTMQRLAEQLSNTAGRPVLDKTGLTGQYAYDLKFSRLDTPTAADSEFPPMPTALQEQLGLKLEPQKAAIEILVIDSAEKPSAN